MEEINENIFFNKCNYRNCGKTLENKRKNAKYCNRKCKSAESVYVLRKEKFIEKYKERAIKEINLIKFMKGTNNF